MTDLTGNGRPDVIVTGMGSNPTASVAGKQITFRALPGIEGILNGLETNIFWYENPGWERHTLASESGLHLGVGSTLCDVDDNGRVDLVVGQGYDHNDIYWYRQPSDPREPWTQHVISRKFQKYHDLATGDVDDDGEVELIGLSQEAATIFYYDIPSNPRVEPWPEECCTIIDDSNSTEGIYIGDIDDDGRTELIAGTTVYSQTEGDWTGRQIATGWDDVRVAAGDIDGDGSPEIVLSEGDSPKYGTHPGRVAWFNPDDWEATVIDRDLFCPHSLQVGDFTGDGCADVFVGEMGLNSNPDPNQYLYCNNGDGSFTKQVISRGVASHEAKAVDLTGDGHLDIVSKSYEPNHDVDAWLNSRDVDTDGESNRSSASISQV